MRHLAIRLAQGEDGPEATRLWRRVLAELGLEAPPTLEPEVLEFDPAWREGGGAIEKKEEKPKPA